MNLILGFILILSPVVSVGSFDLVTKVISLLAFLFYSLGIYVSRAAVPKLLYHFFLTWFSIFIYFFVRSIFSEFRSSDFFIGLFQIFFYVFLGCALSLSYGSEVVRRATAKIFFVTMTINSTIILVQFFSSDLRQLTESIFTTHGGDLSGRSDRYRGIASGGGASLSFSTGISIFVGWWLVKLKELRVGLVGPAMAICFLSIFLIGKSGLLVLLIFCLVLGPRFLIKYIFIFGFLIFLFLYYSDYIDTRLFMRNFSFFVSGTDSTLRGLSLFYEFSLYELGRVILGSGDYLGDLGAGPSDPGLLRLISLGGIGPASVVYLLLITAALKLGPKRGVAFRFWLGLLSAFVIFELKEPLFLKGYAMHLFWFWFGTFLVCSDRRRGWLLQ